MSSTKDEFFNNIGSSPFQIQRNCYGYFTTKIWNQISPFYSKERKKNLWWLDLKEEDYKLFFYYIFNKVYKNFQDKNIIYHIIDISFVIKEEIDAKGSYKEKLSYGTARILGNMDLIDSFNFNFNDAVENIFYKFLNNLNNIKYSKYSEKSDEGLKYYKKWYYPNFRIVASKPEESISKGVTLFNLLDEINLITGKLKKECI